MTAPEPTPKPATATELDKPPVPRSRMSLLMKIYVGLAGSALVLYLLAGVFGWDTRTSQRDRIPGSVRNSPGGYRSGYFWFAGYHGGK